MHKTLSFLAWAVNIFRFRLRTDADCESVTVTVTFAVTLCGISNDFFLKSRQSGRGGGRGGDRRVCLEACQSKLIECLCFIKYDFSASLARPPCQLRQTTAEADREKGGTGGKGRQTYVLNRSWTDHSVNICCNDLCALNIKRSTRLSDGLATPRAVRQQRSAERQQRRNSQWA